MPLFETGQTGLRKFGSHDVQVRYDGDWIKFSTLMNRGDILLAMAAREGQRNFAEAYKDAVIQNMREEGRRFGYEPLSDEYIYKKAKYSGTLKMFAWSGTMMNSIEVMTNAEQTRFMVGIPKGLKRPSYYSGESNELGVDEYANAIEHGFATKGVYVPPRPVFSDTFRKTMGGKKGIAEFIENAIRLKFLTNGIRVIKRFH